MSNDHPLDFRGRSDGDGSNDDDDVATGSGDSGNVEGT